MFSSFPKYHFSLLAVRHKEKLWSLGDSPNPFFWCILHFSPEVELFLDRNDLRLGVCGVEYYKGIHLSNDLIQH